MNSNLKDQRQTFVYREIVTCGVRMKGDLDTTMPQGWVPMTRIFLCSCLIAFYSL